MPESFEPWYSATADAEWNIAECGYWRAGNGYYDHTRRGAAVNRKAGCFVRGERTHAPSGTEFVRGHDGRTELRDIIERKAT